MQSQDDNMPDQDATSPELSWMRVLWVMVIAVMISVAQTLLFAVAVLQIIIMLAAKGRPNDELARFGSLIGDWVAKAARFQAAASDEKPWPWTPIDS